MSNEILIVLISFICLFYSQLERNAAWFAHLSSVCMIVITATFLAIIGVIPSDNPVYSFFLSDATPVAMVLLILNLRLSDLRSVRPKLILLFCIGSTGVLVGGLVAGFIGNLLNITNSDLAIAQLIASYIGGGENAVAMREMIQIPDDLFVAVFAADNIVTSLWMALTLYLARDAGDSEIIEEVGSMKVEGLNLESLLFNIGISVLVVAVSSALSEHVGFFHRYMYLTIIALIIGQFSYVRSRINGSYLLGSFLFLGFFFSIGAISIVSSFSDVSLYLLCLPFIIVLTQGAFIYLGARFLKLSRVEVATVSQSLIGGPATAVAIAHSKGWREGVSIAMLFGILGYAVGNYISYFAYLVLKVPMICSSPVWVSL